MFTFCTQNRQFRSNLSSKYCSTETLKCSRVVICLVRASSNALAMIMFSSLFLSECVSNEPSTLKSAQLRCLLYLCCTNSPRKLNSFNSSNSHSFPFGYFCCKHYITPHRTTNTGHVLSGEFKYIRIWARQPRLATQRQQSIARRHIILSGSVVIIEVATYQIFGD